MGTTRIANVTKELTIQATECGECGVVFGLGSAFVKNRLNDHKAFYCPNGCNVSWSGPSKVEQERDAARSLAEREGIRRRRAEAEAEHQRRSAAAQKGWNTRIRNRIANGVCPCCNRSFENVRRHMTTQHPDFVVPTDE